MSPRLFFNVLSRTIERPIQFAERAELDEIRASLEAKEVVLIEIDASRIGSREDLFKLFAIALKMPKGFYGPEAYAPNSDAFLEYLDDVENWIPGRRIIVLSGAETFWKDQARLAGFLCELWLFSVLQRDSKSHLLFVW